MKLSKFISFSTLILGFRGQVSDKKKEFKEEYDDIIRQHPYLALSPPFAEALENDYFDFGGDTVINKNSHIRLTADKPSKQGYIWSTKTLPKQNWKVEFEFKVTGAGSTISGDGFAFWATEERMVPGPVFGSKDNFKGLGVFFDTYSNGYHSDFTFPYIFGFIGDGVTQYSLSDDGVNQNIGNCSISIRNKSYVTKATVIYVRGKFLIVAIQDEESGKPRNCFYNKGVTLPDRLYMGFSALTGQLSDNHDILNVKTYHAEVNPDAPDQMYQRKGASRGKGPSFVGFLFKVLIVGVIGYLIYLGYNKYAVQSKKRF
ncbi:concanavalin A-like lectin/glucanase [Conidiobolus coronatus NRRL 28638]|uniref:Concanavalin A-like lectin/glucanase n=1 Tax=Conidiobolus coronatus (strain ATCC 28846 / CBS 209.66 / NRRL 28638) TaxID=796925 RepID=A0A137NVW8_CONC2|nr:concanavalin A-like lectin/glucanase [Conidiobolus coronatus NRRL 28638]|eukprot:KXN66922.1 concanavalin A-like lectin/glucanase [Conidiobolus coronatus NRRL 28638]